MTDTAAETAAPRTPARPVRPFLWSVRREVWEHRSLYIAPLAVAGVVLFGTLMAVSGVRHFQAAGFSPDALKRQEMALASFGFAAFAVAASGVVVGILYALGALYNERRDRSILFWKSLPVSDVVTVLAKASIPLAVLPAIVFAVAVALFIAMVAVVSVSPAGAFAAASLPPLAFVVEMLLYGLVVATLWHAPLWSWLLLVSAWARRTPFLWAFLPPVGVILFEKIALGTDHVHRLLAYRLGGWRSAFAAPAHGPGSGLPQPDPLGFFTNPDLWIGLAAAAALLAAAVWVRRYREPI